jgi:hypothetical protein
MAQPFVWTGNTGQIGTPQQAQSAREVAALLAQGRQKVAQNGWEGLAQLSNAWAERGWRDQAAQAEEAGIKSAAEALAGITPQSGFSDIAGALSNPWLSQPQSTIAAALLQQNLQSQDPAYQLDLAYKQAQIDKMNAEMAGGGQSATSFGTPIWGTDPNGNAVFGTLDNAGNFNVTATPEGFSFGKEPIRLDTGTEYTLLDPVTRQVVGTQPKNIRDAASESAAGTVEGRIGAEAAAAAPADVQTGEMALDLINQIKTHPELEWATGTSAGLGGNAIPGTGRYDFQNLVEQAKSGAFLSAIQQMRGMGSLSNAEGQAATQAVTRMNTATSTEAFLKAVDDYERIVRAGLNKARGRLPGGASPETLSPASSEVVDWTDL